MPSDPTEKTSRSRANCRVLCTHNRLDFNHRCCCRKSKRSEHCESFVTRVQNIRPLHWNSRNSRSLLVAQESRRILEKKVFNGRWRKRGNSTSDAVTGALTLRRVKNCVRSRVTVRGRIREENTSSFRSVCAVRGIGYHSTGVYHSGGVVACRYEFINVRSLHITTLGNDRSILVYQTRFLMFFYKVDMLLIKKISTVTFRINYRKIHYFGNNAWLPPLRLKVRPWECGLKIIGTVRNGPGKQTVDVENYTATDECRVRSLFLILATFYIRTSRTPVAHLFPRIAVASSSKRATVIYARSAEWDDYLIRTDQVLQSFEQYNCTIIYQPDTPTIKY